MIQGIIASTAPLVLVALGGLLSERAGILNIALEGMILGGAFTAIVMVWVSGSLLWSCLAAMAAGYVMALLFNISVFSLKGNPFIAGLGINILVPALISSICQGLYGNQGIIRPDDLPALPNLGGMDMFTLVAFGAVPAMMLLFYRTREGLIIRACGEEPELIRSRGIDPVLVQKRTILMSGVLAAFAGACLSLRLGVYVPEMSAGKGWIALVIIYLGYRKIPGILAAGFFFAAAEWGANRAQGSFGLPPTLILSFPYFLTLAGLWIFSSRQKAKNS